MPALTSLPRLAKVLVLAFVDGGLALIAFWAAVLVRTGSFPVMPRENAVAASVVVAFLVPAVAFAYGLYRPVIRFQIPRLSLHIGLVAIFCGATIAAIGAIGGATASRAIGLGVVFSLNLFVLILLSRNVARLLLDGRSGKKEARIAIYGAGQVGRKLAALMREDRAHRPVTFIDDDPALQGRLVESLPVLNGSDKRLGERLAAHRITQIFLAIPSLKPGRRREILERLVDLPYRVRSVPDITDLVTGEARNLVNVRDISVEELLGRDPVLPLPGLLEKCVRNKTILVTGGGGSIGLELCRQVQALGPARLIVLDHSEFALYQAEMELRRLEQSGRQYSKLFVLGSVTDRRLVESIFANDRVDTVYHAAAYKHVPIVEANALEGLRNNTLGTWYVAKAASRLGVRHFILISSDKAVRPTNVMGATKRMAELVIQMLSSQCPHTVFSMVRFGNVLASSGSVVPLFKEQIEKGGPVTLTHPDVIRYFMTIQEAVQLVIQAGAMAKGGEVFVLDMGKPVPIKDLAVRMIRLAGRSVRDAENPHGDIAIEIIGLRPGEKLFEELLIGGETAETSHPRIWLAREPFADPEALEADLKGFLDADSSMVSDADVPRLLRKWVAGYRAYAPKTVDDANAEPMAAAMPT